MRKYDLSEAISKDCGIDFDTAERAVESFIKNVKKANERGEEVILRGFGVWSVRIKPTRKARNMALGIPMLIPAHSYPYFKPYGPYSEKIKKSNPV